MLVLGLILILIAAAITAGAVYDGGESVSLSFLGATISNITVAGVFLAGLATTVVFFLGLWMIMNALARARRKRHDRKETTRRQEQSVSEIAAEKARLAEENDRLNERLAQSRPPVVDSNSHARGGRGDHAESHVDSPSSERGTSQTHDAGYEEGTHTRPTENSDSARPTHPDRTIGSSAGSRGESGDHVIDHRADLTINEERAGSTNHRRDI